MNRPPHDYFCASNMMGFIVWVSDIDERTREVRILA